MLGHFSTHARFSLLICFAGFVFCVLHGRAEAQEKSHVDQARPTARDLVVDSNLKEREAIASDIAQVNTPIERFDELSYKGWDVPFPSTGDTVIGDKFGIRSFLAKHGIGFLSILANQAVYDIGGQNARLQPQAYNGQDVTYSLGTHNLTITYDAGRVGLKNGQLQFQGAVLANGYRRLNGPRGVRVETLAYYQSLLDGAVEIKFGIIDNTQEFLGVSVGGSSAGGALGPQAIIPFQVGMSYNGFGTASINLRVNAPRYLYSKLGIQRSLVPGGATAENAANSSGLAFAPRGTRPLVIEEFGYNRPAASGSRSLWVRVGGLYNFTDFPSYRDGSTVSHNWAAFAAIDAQISQQDDHMPFRGVYVGVTTYIAPKEQNVYTKYAEARIYGIGILRRRPFDMATLVGSHNKFGPVAIRSLTSQGKSSYRSTTSLIASYAYRLAPGIYLQPGLGAVIHPAIVPRLGTAVNAYLGLAIFL